MVVSTLPPDALAEAYTTLRIPRTAPLSEVRKSWKSLCLKHHPDKQGGDVTQFQKVQKAYEYICSESKKTPEQRKKEAKKQQQQQRRRRAEEAYVKKR